jgi:peptidoglycan hydrolase-like protein with peptidoglycan-binding domain
LVYGWCMPIDLNSIPYIPARFYTPGRRADISMIVIHDMEAGEYSTTAESCANYFKNTTRRASAHYCCDNDSVVCSVLPDDTAWHTGENETNNSGIGIEQAGYANQGIGFSWTEGGIGWADTYSQDMIKNQVAPLVAALCDRYGIPVRFLSADDLRNGERAGITSHREITYGFGIYGGHTDPGPDYPWDQLLEEVNKHIGAPLEQMPMINRPTPPASGSDAIYRIGSTGDFVVGIQKVVGAAQDGVYGPQTAAAVANWQRALQIPADGVWGPRTQEATGQFFAWLAQQQPAPAPEPDNYFLSALNNATSQVLREGSAGDAVKILQSGLTLKGYYLVADGVFGPNTANAVRRFQSDHGLQVDGVVGPKTWGALVA